MTARQPRGDHDAAYVDGVADAITAAMPALDATDQQIAAAIHRLMSVGDPVEPAAVASAAAVPVDRVIDKLDAWPGVFRDDRGRLVGFWGHSVQKLDPEYRLVADGRTTYAWCALDTLFLPGIVGKTVAVEASDPISLDAVTLVVDGNGVRDVQPSGARISMVVPEGPFGYDVIESFCHRVLFFASEQTGRKWMDEHKGTTLLTVDEGFDLGSTLTERIAPEAFGVNAGTR